MIRIQDTYVKSKSVSSWSCRSYVNPIKNLSKKKKCCKRTLILKRVTRVNIFFLDCSTVSNNSENDDTFIERTTRPRSTSQPLATKKTSTSLRNELTNTRNKLSEGKIYFDRNFNYTELAKLTRDSSCYKSSFKTCKNSKLPYWVRIKQIRSDVLSVLMDY